MDKRVKLHDFFLLLWRSDLIDGASTLTIVRDTLNASRDVMALVIDDPLRANRKRDRAAPPEVISIALSHVETTDNPHATVD